MPNTKLSICFFGDGESVHTQRWLREMVKRHFQVTLITRRPILLPGIKVLTVTDSLGKLGWLRRVFEIRRMVSEINPDIVHGHYITSYGFWAAASGVHPMILTAWGSDILVTPKRSFLMRALVSWTISRADVVTADSADVVDEINRYPFNGLALQIQWGVDLELFKPSKKIDNPVFNVLSLRTWSENYNIDIIIRSFYEFTKRRPKISGSLYLLGGGPSEHLLRQLVSNLGLEHRVIFIGHKSEAELPVIIDQCSVSVSVPTSDATAMSLLESMAMELPVIVSNLPANRQWISDRNGFIVEPRNIESLASALTTLADNSDLQKSMGAINRQEVSLKASRQIEMDKMAEIYSSIFIKKS